MHRDRITIALILFPIALLVWLALWLLGIVAWPNDDWKIPD